MLKIPFFNELENTQNILIAGMGGGYDIFSGLPLYFGLKDEGKQVHLANLSFSYLPPLEYCYNKERLSPSLLKVTADTPLLTDYFPEKFLAQWFKEQGTEIPIYCFERTGVKPLLANYRTLVEKLSLDTIILVDGGTDSLMRGDEIGLGTPQEDMSSLTAVNEIEVENKMMACLAFGVDYFHGVCHTDFLEAVAEITRNKGYLGMFSLTEEMPEVKKFKMATEFVFELMPQHTSIVASSVLSALEGNYGNHHTTPRTKNSTLWINPLMPVYWCFKLEPVTQRLLYLEAMKNTNSFEDVINVIEEFRDSCDTIVPQQEKCLFR